TVPREYAALPQKRGSIRRRSLRKPERNGRAMVLESLGIGNSEKAQAGNRNQTFDQSRHKSAFVCHGRTIRGKQRRSAVLRRRIAAPPQLGEVFDRGMNPRDQFLHLRSGFPTLWNCIRRRTHFVRLEALQVLSLSVKRPHVRSEKFIGRA